jgi:alpha-beta hydrolase superfamily lysophospholipase
MVQSLIIKNKNKSQKQESDNQQTIHHGTGYLDGHGNKKVFYQYWLPQDDPKARLLIVHGLAEHSGRYVPFVNFFVPKGYAVYGMDHIGHGRSDGHKVFINKFDDFSTTLKMMVDRISTEESKKPIFLVGHSMGALISLVYLIEHQKDIDGCIISGPLVKIPDSVPTVQIIAGKVLSKIAPKMGVLKLNPQKVSRDPEVVRSYIDDPLVFSGQVTARLSAEISSAIAHLRQNFDKISCPILILQGDADKLVDANGAPELYKHAASKDKTLKIYKGLYHEVYNEPEKVNVFNDVNHWIHHVISASSSYLS